MNRTFQSWVGIAVAVGALNLAFGSDSDLTSYKGLGTPAVPNWLVTESSGNTPELAIRIQIPGFAAVPVAGGYALQIPGQTAGIRSGAPDLPELARVFHGFAGFKAKVEIVRSYWTSADPVHVAPKETWSVNPDWSLGPDVEQSLTPRPERVESPDIYAANTYWPADIASVEEAWMGNQKLVRVAFYPIQYNPASGELRFYTNLEARVVFEPDAQVARNEVR